MVDKIINQYNQIDRINYHVALDVEKLVRTNHPDLEEFGRVRFEIRPFGIVAYPASFRNFANSQPGLGIRRSSYEFFVARQIRGFQPGRFQNADVLRFEQIGPAQADMR